LPAVCRQADLLHIHGLWRFDIVEALRVARSHGVPTVVSPMGSFAPPAMRLSGVRKRAFWQMFLSRALRGSACFHATSLAEHDDMRDFGIRQPIAVIPLAVEAPHGAAWEPPGRGPGDVLFLGRIAPIKNLVSLVRAWSRVQSAFPDARLRILGPDERGHRRDLLREIARTGVRGVTVEPGAWGAARDRAFRAADLVVLPSLSESFGLVVAEALAAGRPAIATRHSPWQLLEMHRCGWSVDPTPEGIARALNEALALPGDELAAMGMNGRRLAESAFSWPRVTARFAAMYEWVLGGGPVPEFVST
jgi:glycosyltransferase involved in cell wall biosynthesis